ncbi:MAG TPA: hypothetical protein VFG76_06840 [Candidatus Polarisedimenticolia bacterium]|nr:hypothetical protein [Candidatus Polarisedimenticolia bacterium]
MPNAGVATGGTVLAVLSDAGSSNDLVTGKTERVNGRTKVTIDPNTGVSLPLVPNDAITPANTYYAVTFEVNAPVRTSWTELWSVTATPDPVEIGDVARLQTAPGLTCPACTLLTAGGYSYFRHVGTTPVERWYVAGSISGIAIGNAAIAENVIYAAPLTSERGGRIDQLAVSLNTACTVISATGKARIGIYTSTSDTNLYPDALVVDAGEVSFLTNGVKTLAVNVLLSPSKLYWVVMNEDCDNADPSMRVLGATASAPILGVSTAFAGGNSGNGWSVNMGYAPLPATFPAGGTVSINNLPAIAVRYSQ